MPATIADIDATLLDYRDDDKPVVLARNLIEEYREVANVPQLFANITSRFSDGDNSDANYPIRRLADRSRSTEWRYNGAATTLYILLDCGTSLPASAVVIEGHNGTLDGGTVRVRASDTLGGWTTLSFPSTLTTFPVAKEREIALLNREYTARYWEIQLDTGATSNIKRLTQLWLARQAILPHKASVPYDEHQAQTGFGEVLAKSGARRRVGYFSRLARKEFDIPISDSDSVDALRIAYIDSDGFSLPIWFIENPYSDPDGLPTAIVPAASVFGFVESGQMAIPTELTEDAIWSDAIDECGPFIEE